jgi:hypothetical protein
MLRQEREEIAGDRGGTAHCPVRWR